MNWVKISLVILLPFFGNSVLGQNQGWQQRAEYQMDIKMNVETDQFAGKQTLTYFNNSPDTLYRVFYHLYFNAFQPSSMMDVRSRTIKDPDPRVGDRICALAPDEIGFQKINSLLQDGKKTKFSTEGTILEVDLASPILPGSKTMFEMDFEAQVPIQVRRSGRDNKEEIEYSMSQWYPKLSEYDYQGWHANPYVAREFHGVWGDFDVKITIDASYVLGGTGELQNASEIGHGYEGIALDHPEGGLLTWHFKAKDVHDFVWAADPDYKHVIRKTKNGPELHFLYQENESTKHWEDLPEYIEKAFDYMSLHFGKYPFSQYSIIQGGDGGMEYPMATLITGHRSLGSLVGVTVHEMGHSWYQMVLATNESLYPWMDEGFTTYAATQTMAELFPKRKETDIFEGSYRGYYSLVEEGLEEPLCTHADHYELNRAYGTASYSKGVVFLHQLSYIIGQNNLDRALLRYFEEWKFKHPTPNDFLRICEKISGLELDWYFQKFILTNQKVDYAIISVIQQKDSTFITLEKKGGVMMPIELSVEFENKDAQSYYIPLRIMRGEKPSDALGPNHTTLPDWPWTNPVYVVGISTKKRTISRIEIDPSNRLADYHQSDNLILMSDLRKK